MFRHSHDGLFDNTKDQGNLEEAQTLLMNVLEKEPHHVQALCLMKAHLLWRLGGQAEEGRSF